MRLTLALYLALSLLSVASALAAEPSDSSGSWAFRPIQNSAVPRVTNGEWVRDDLDCFILARLEGAKLSPTTDAGRSVLLRRLTFDLTGLPPTEKQIDDFLGDSATDERALARLVDALLDSPGFGERWARHWLDTARYADSVGHTYNPPFTYAWRYRDYVIDALNNDKPYDRFLTEQLAGDQLPFKSVAERRENLKATGFLALGAFDLQALDRGQYELDCIDDQIDVTTRAMLGLTIACARCHDHKYDPISTRDYYALAGIFSSTRRLPGVSYRGEGNGYVDHEQLIVLPVSKGGQTVLPALVPGVHSMNDYNDLWRSGQRQIRYTTDPNLCLGVTEGKAADCAVRVKGDPHDYGETPPRGELRIGGLPRMNLPAEGSSGRLELARWITSPEHPLTARVAVNRVWLHLFGLGLAATPDNFGVGSEPPSHPELLDHLAVRFVHDGWSLKRLIRALVLSRTYRLSSESGANMAAKTDTGNRLYWRANRRLLEKMPGHPELEGLIESYELAFKMQTSVPDTLDLSREPAKIRDLYRLDEADMRNFGTQCLMARRLAEKGVRFIQLTSIAIRTSSAKTTTPI